jgi:hypothetical protein
MEYPYKRRNASLESEMHRIVQQLWSWLPTQDPDEHYLADASDLADLERRMRRLECASSGPMFVTFNH